MRGWPPGVYEHLAALPDEEFTEQMSETEPPVRVES